LSVPMTSIASEAASVLTTATSATNRILIMKRTCLSRSGRVHPARHAAGAGAFRVHAGPDRYRSPC
jgi:hypothetical protein